MATFKAVFLTVTVLVATSNAAPNKFDFKIPEECRGKGFCNIKPEGYDEMQELIKKLLTPMIIAQSVGNRIGEGAPEPELSPQSDWHNCPYWKKTESMYAYSHNNESHGDYIIQNELLDQPIDIITCANEKIEQDTKTECFQHLGLSSFNMKSSCQSTTAQRSLLVFDYKLRQIKKKSYDVPCCCTCQITRSV